MTRRIVLFLLPFALPLYTVRFHIGPIPTTALEVLIVIAFGVWMLSGKSPNTKVFPKIKSLPIVLFFIAGVISIVIAPDKIAALGLWRAYILEPLLVFAMAADLIRKKEDRAALVWGLFGITLFVAAWAMLQRLGILPIPAPWDAPPSGVRATGPFPYPNAAALFVVPIGAYFISKFFYKDLPAPLLMKDGIERNGGIFLLGFLAAFLVSYLAQSDGGMIALLAAAGVAMLLHYLPTPASPSTPANAGVHPHGSRVTCGMISLVIALALTVTAISIPSIREPLTDKLFFRDWSGMVRLVIWDETARMLRDRPFFGAGLGAYPTVITQYDHAPWMETFQYPHNIILNFWSEMGLLGLIAFFWILVRWYRANPTATLPIIAAILVHGIVDVSYFKNDLAVLFWILVALTVWTKTKKSVTLAAEASN